MWGRWEGLPTAGGLEAASNRKDSEMQETRGASTNQGQAEGNAVILIFSFTVAACMLPKPQLHSLSLSSGEPFWVH